jgi:hypothetical protein
MSRIERHRRGDLGDEEIADVDVFTSARARELRFGTAPGATLSFSGKPGERHSSETERENLPERVEAGQTYRKVEIRWRARARIVHPADADD